MSKVLKQEICNCWDCPFRETEFNNKVKGKYVYTCFHTKKKLYKDFHIPKWCVLPDYEKKVIK